MRRRVLVLSAVHLAVAGALAAFVVSQGAFGAPAPLVAAFALGFACVGLLPVHLELGRHAMSVTLVEAVLVAALVWLSPVGVVVAAVLGESAALLVQRQSRLKLLFNATGMLAASSLAVAVFELAPASSAGDPLTWVAALVATVSYGVLNHATTSAVVGAAEGRAFSHVAVASLAPAFATTVVSGSIGLVAVVLSSVAPAAPLLVAPLVVLMVVETRRLSAHRAEHLRFERLYAASSRTGGLQGMNDVLATLASESRTLASGDAAACCTQDRSGRWFGVIVDDSGQRPAGDEVVRSLLALSRREHKGEVRADEMPPLVRHALGGVPSVIVVRAPDGAAAPVLLAVMRALGTDESSAARTEVLDAFVGHAALTVANARLYEDVEHALAHQVDLNRQKDDFVAVVSHELRTPLTAMIGSVSTIKRMDERLTLERRATLLDIALRQGHRLQRLIEDLLLLASVEGARGVTRQQDNVNLRALVEDIVAELGDNRAGQPPVDVQLETLGLPMLTTDEQKLRQVLTNLVENACKYAPGSPIRVRAEERDGQLVIQVIDRGPGISEADRDRVFERFVQLDQSSTRTQGGTGLGLYLCRQLAALLGGTLELSEAPGGGCCFTLTVPTVPASVPLEAQTSAALSDRDIDLVELA